MYTGRFSNGDLVPLEGQEELVRGGEYELAGTMNWLVMAGLPDSWVQEGLIKLYGMTHSDFRVLGAELLPDGRFRIRVIATHNSPVVILAIAVVGLAVLAGMKIEQIYQVVTGTGPDGSAGPFAGGLTLMVWGSLAALGVYVWAQLKRGGS